MIYNLERIMNSAIILAGGIGKRLNSEIPKQFIRLDNGKRIIDFSIEAFKKNKNINEIIIVLPPDWIDRYGSDYIDYTLVSGGKERYESSKEGLLACCPESRNVLIHDAARPLISQNLIDDCIYYLNQYDAVAPCIAATDSLIEVDDEVSYLNRSNIKFIQTPQGFNKNLLLNVMADIENDVSDDMSAVLAYDKNINYKFFQGEVYNFKITHDLDIKIFNNILNEK